MFLNERGGIIDDAMITKHAPDAFYVVTNAGRRAEDLAWFAARLAEWNVSERAKDGPVEHELLDGWGLLALQGTSYAPFCKSALMTSKNGQIIGPASADLLQALTSYDLRALTFGRSAFVPLEGINVHVARGGYTGEDGFEVSLPNYWLLASSLLTVG